MTLNHLAYVDSECVLFIERKDFDLSDFMLADRGCMGVGPNGCLLDCYKNSEGHYQIGIFHRTKKELAD